MSKQGRAYQYQLTQGETVLMTGDEQSIGVIFNNLTGVNFADKEPGGYADYLAYMSRELGIEIKPGQLRMLSPEGEPIKGQTL